MGYLTSSLMTSLKPQSKPQTPYRTWWHALNILRHLNAFYKFFCCNSQTCDKLQSPLSAACFFFRFNPLLPPLLLFHQTDIFWLGWLMNCTFAGAIGPALTINISGPTAARKKVVKYYYEKKTDLKSASPSIFLTKSRVFAQKIIYRASYSFTIKY